MERTILRPVIDQIATGERIKKIRKEQGFSVRDIQNIFGFDYPQAVYAWEQGKNVPTVDNLLVLASLFECDIEDMLVARQVRIILDCTSEVRSA